MNTISKLLTPWVLLAFMVIIFISGAIGLFIGYNVAENRFQEARLHMVALQNQALDERNQRLVEATARNQQLEKQFMLSISDLASNYKILSAQLAEELKDDIYTQCQVPLTGKQLLQKSVIEANKRK
ncbi:hypothetical protein BIW22_20850 [Salmonella enterica]|nr:hypothetical protein [Salmonella enterica]EFO7976597.1 hypothetical protein [Salmonella enterica]